MLIDPKPKCVKIKTPQLHYICIFCSILAEIEDTFN